MNTHLPTFVFLAIGCILLAGTARSILTASHVTAGQVKITFDAPSPASQPAAEPLFPGLPAR